MVSYGKSIDETSILIVEDHLPLLRSLSFLLTSIGFDVQAVTDGAAALDVLQTWTPDLIISDMQMPRMGGCELLSCVRADERWSETAFIALPGVDDADAVTAAMRLGADDFVPKPFNVYDVLDAIKRTLKPRPDGLVERRAAS